MTVQAIERAFSILQAVAAHPNGASVTAVSRQADLHKSTVSRLLATLEAVQAVERHPDSNLFRIGSGIHALTTPLSFNQQLINIAAPFLQQLTAQLGEDSGLCVPEGDQVLQIDQGRSEQHIQVRNWVGERYPLHISVTGKLFLAYFDEERREQYLHKRPLTPVATSTYTDPDRLRRHLAEIRQQGYTWAVNEFADGLAGLAAPIFNAQHQIVAAISVYGPSFRFPGARRTEAVSLILEMGRIITTRLTSQSP